MLGTHPALQKPKGLIYPSSTETATSLPLTTTAAMLFMPSTAAQQAFPVHQFTCGGRAERAEDEGAGGPLGCSSPCHLLGAWPAVDLRGLRKPSPSLERSHSASKWRLAASPACPTLLSALLYSAQLDHTSITSCAGWSVGGWGGGSLLLLKL